MEIQIEERETVTILIAAGALTVDHGVNRLPGLVRDVIDEGRTRLVLDLEAVDFMDSLGLEALLAANSAVENRGGRMALAGMQQKLNRLIEITRLGEVFERYETREAAIRALGFPAL